MIAKHMDETAINASLDACLHGAQEGNAYQARRLHELLDQMLTERETGEGQLWLTDHARLLLAEMHRRLSRCEGDGQVLSESVLDAVRLKPRKRDWEDACSWVKDLRIAISVAAELCEQKNAGKAPDLSAAAQAVAAKRGR